MTDNHDDQEMINGLELQKRELIGAAMTVGLGDEILRIISLILLKQNILMASYDVTWHLGEKRLIQNLTNF